MFLDSAIDQRPIAPNLLEQAHSLEKRYSGLHIIAAREFRYPVQQQKVSVRAEQRRKINLLEKFLLRAYTQISPPPSLEELAGALSIDPVFIRSTFEYLINLRHIRNTNERAQVTEEGKQTLSSEIVSQGDAFDTQYFIQDNLRDMKNFSRKPLDEVDEALEDLSLSVKKDLTDFPVFNFQRAILQDQLVALGLTFHSPEDGRFVKVITPLSTERGWKTLALFLEYDKLKENSGEAITVTARQDQDTIPGLGEWLASEFQKQNLSLNTLFQLSDDLFVTKEIGPDPDSPEDQLVEERLESIGQQAMTQMRLQRAGEIPEQDAKTVLQLRDVEIRPAFLDALQEAREQIIIYSPWINEQVVDDDFLSLLESRVQQGVHILIGYGIGRHEKKEERPLPPDLQQRLRAVQTAEGTPGIIAEWLGNSHAKEIVIDRRIHFNGSHNWLSYRGDRLPRGETVYKVTIPTEVEKAYQHFAHRFLERAQALWLHTGIEERRIALSILGYLGHEQQSAEWLQRAACYDLLPLWLALAQQAISAGHEARILPTLSTIMPLCATAIGQADPLSNEISLMLQKTFTVLKQQNAKLMATFVRDNAALLGQFGFLIKKLSG